MKWNWKREILPAAVILATAVLTFVLFPMLPDVVPIHFDADGKPDSYASKTTAVLPAIGGTVGIYLLLTFIPFIDPFWKRIQNKYDILLVFRDLAMLFMLFFYIMTIVAAKEGVFPVRVMGIGMGFLFVLMGNYLPKLPRNWFFGIRVPWTLASEVVWRKTHALGGWLFVSAGLVIVLLSLFGVNTAISLLATLLPVVLIVCFIYPFSLFKRLQKEGNGTSANTL